MANGKRQLEDRRRLTVGSHRRAGRLIWPFAICHLPFAIVLAAYLLSGFFVVRGNETAVVRRFGAAVKNANGEVRLWPSGWHYDCPWPFATVDRVKLNEVRTLSIGNLEQDAPAQSSFLRNVDPARQAQFLSGDKNILNVQISVSYRVSDVAIGDFLFAAVSPERRLQTLAQSVLADAMLHSGVDFAHTLGRNELRELMTSRLQRLASEQRLGLTVDDVTIGNVTPPLRVKAEFIDVMNARADKETSINQARAYSEQREAEARATARRATDTAEVFRRQSVESAKAESESFSKLIAQLQSDEQSGRRSYAESRQLTLRRKYLDTLEEVLRKVAAKVVLDSGQAIDLTILREQKAGVK
ncbi:MAG: protease modulator HflK [Planctomycetaceae bacterium]